MTAGNTPRRDDPTHIIWQVIGDGEAARWIAIGAAWKGKAGSLSCRKDAYPVAGRMVIREAAFLPRMNGAR